MPMPSWVPLVWRPNARQRELWWAYISSEDGTDEQGWWLGWCPLHDTTHSPAAASARFNFRSGAYKCLAESCCHAPKGAMSLTNLAAAMIAPPQARSNG